MMPLILPPHLQGRVSPSLQNYATVDLMQELQRRGFLHELHGEQAMAADPGDFIGESEYKRIRAATMLDMLRQMGVTIGQAGRAQLLVEQTPDPSTPSGFREILHAKILICQHPEDGQLVFQPPTQAQLAELPQPGRMDSTPESQISLPFASGQPDAPEPGPLEPNSPVGLSSTKKGRKSQGV